MNTLVVGSLGFLRKHKHLDGAEAEDSTVLMSQLDTLKESKKENI